MTSAPERPLQRVYLGAKAHDTVRVHGAEAEQVSPDWSTLRAGFRPWLLTGLGPWVVADLRVEPSDFEAFHQENEAGAARRIRWMASGLLVLNALAWTTDARLLNHLPGVQPALGEGRLVMTLFGALIVALSLLGPFNRRVGAIALAWLASCGLCGGVAWTMGRIGGPSTAWFHFTYVFIFVSLMAWARPLHRAAIVAAIAASILAAYFGLNPAHLDDPLAASAATHLALLAVVAVALGFWLDASRLRLYLYRRVTARSEARLEQRVAEQTARIQGLLDHVERAREDERRDLAAELHDEMGQVLTGMRLTLRVARTRADADANPLSGALEQLGGMMQHLSWAVRNLLVRLRPRVLDDLGFVAAAEWLAGRTDALPGLRCTFTAPAALPELSPDAATAAFRVVQEALTNAVRHAGASEIRVELIARHGIIEVSVVDDGVGFDSEGGAHPGMGLLGMAERARAQAGQLEIITAPGQGTRVRLTLPAAPPGDGTNGISGTHGIDGIKDTNGTDDIKSTEYTHSVGSDGAMR